MFMSSRLRVKIFSGVVALSALALAPPLLSTQAAKPNPAREEPAPAAISWKDIGGKQYGPDDVAKAKATAFLFTSNQCPVAGRYGARYAALAKMYSAKGVAFYLVNANASDSLKGFTEWAKARNLNLPMVKDENHALADRLSATTTPQAVLLDAAGKIIYLGAIDDNADAQKVTRQDLKSALDDALAGKAVRVSRTRAFGCAIFRDSPTFAAVTTKVTYAQDIAPILQKNCLSCHRAGDVGPFPLENYENAKQWASAIKDYTARRLMPPWKATPDSGDFHDARYLSDNELAKIAAWADGGTPPGDLKRVPVPPKMAPAGQWELGKPDVVLQTTRPFHLESDGRDVYRNFTLPMDYNEDRYVSAFDFQPGNRAIVHHIIAYIDTTGQTAAARDNKETEPGWSVSGGGSGIKDDDWGAGWAPGMNPRRLPPGVAVKIPKGAKLVLQVHYHKSGRPESDQSKVALYYAKEPVQKILKTAALGNVLFSLKPNEAQQKVKASMIIPFDAKIWAVMPHMHMIGKEMKVWAVLPDGTEKSLIWIKNWEFNWQMAYRYKEPIALPKGTRINLYALYDNTTGNPNQPSNPPKFVTFGEQTTDEMCFAFLGFTREEPIKENKSAFAAPVTPGRIVR